jgi:hypothetical protein
MFFAQWSRSIWIQEKDGLCPFIMNRYESGTQDYSLFSSSYLHAFDVVVLLGAMVLKKMVWNKEKCCRRSGWSQQFKRDLLAKGKWAGDPARSVSTPLLPFKVTVLWDFIGPFKMLMDSTWQGHVSRRFSDFLNTVQNLLPWTFKYSAKPQIFWKHAARTVIELKMKKPLKNLRPSVRDICTIARAYTSTLCTAGSNLVNSSFNVLL